MLDTQVKRLAVNCSRSQALTYHSESLKIFNWWFDKKKRRDNAYGKIPFDLLNSNLPNAVLKYIIFTSRIQIIFPQNLCFLFNCWFCSTKLKSSTELKKEANLKKISCISALVLEWRMFLKAISAALTISLWGYENSYCGRVVILLVLYFSLSAHCASFLIRIICHLSLLKARWKPWFSRLLK